MWAVVADLFVLLWLLAAVVDAAAVIAIIHFPMLFQLLHVFIFC